MICKKIQMGALYVPLKLYPRLARFQDSDAMQMGSALFWDLAQRRSSEKSADLAP